ncbi:fam-a protein [Plasmodium vinckei]|uniref:Fam-a protein n=1 Tax=Plasmodium vinckei TaxID=5860 RepID=A0A6V7TDD7_PLAVN|nr:fam-a protein [Plasmodium vinckei]
MNKFYIQIIFFLLSISLYANNKAFASNPVPRKFRKYKNVRYSTPEELYEKNRHLLCTDPEETKKVEELMKEAITHFKYHSVYVDGYERYPTITDCCVRLYRKEHEGHTNVDKIEYSVWDANNYDPIINEIWDPDHATFFNAYSVKRKIARVYNPNLVLIEQRYKKSLFGPYKYFYALATKFEMSKYVTLIVMASPNINDHYPSDKEYKNTIIENANLLKIDVDSEDDIRKGKLKKTFVNLAGHYIQKYNTHVDVTFVGSIDGHPSF